MGPGGVWGWGGVVGPCGVGPEGHGARGAVGPGEGCVALLEEFIVVKNFGLEGEQDFEFAFLLLRYLKQTFLFSIIT